MEKIDEAIGRDLPALGDAGNRVQIHGVLGDQALEEGGENAVFAGAGGQMGVEVGQFRADAAMEDLLAVAALDVGFAAAARRQDDGQNAQPCAGQESGGEPLHSSGPWKAAPVRGRIMRL